MAEDSNQENRVDSAELKGGEVYSDSRPLVHKKKFITIEGARANNLKNLNLKIPKGKITVLAGVSGSGKSSLLHNVLEGEARRRYLESLNMYERQGTKERGERSVDSIKGLGVTAQVSQGRRMFNPRFTVGSQTELIRHLAVLLATEGVLSPGYPDVRLEPGHFIPGNYSSSCTDCNGLGFHRTPNPNKLIVHREKPLCAGAMFSPGFFPQGYLGKPYNGGYYIVQALGLEFHFDPFLTPWEEMSHGAQQAFLYGTENDLNVYYENKKGENIMSKYADFTFAHAGLNVEDFKAAEAWYVENLNLTVARSVPGNMSFLADPTGRVILEVYSNKAASVMDFKKTHFLTLHMAFLVEDPERTAEKLVKAGATITDPFKVVPGSGDKMIMLQDPYGLSIQFIKRKEPMF